MEIQHPATAHRYITTSSGVNIGPPGVFQPEHVRLHDIKVALAKQCRYNGHIGRFYSVAEHSVLVSRFAEVEGDFDAMLPGLLHDAHEAYMGDLASPHKAMIPGFNRFEEAMEVIVRTGLNLPPQADPVWRRVKRYDTLMLHREIRALWPTPPDWLDPKMEGLVPASIQPVGLEWQEAEAFFRQRMMDLGLGLGGNA